LEISLIQLELQSQLLLELFSKRPVPKLAWITFADLTKIAQNGRLFFSFYDQWLQALPSELSDEDIAGIDPNIWLYLYDEWVLKGSSKWIDIPEFIQYYLTIAKEKSIAWVQQNVEIHDKAGVWIPVIEQIGKTDEIEYQGRLRCLQIRLNKISSVNEDRLVMERVEGNSQEDDSTLQQIIKATKLWIESQYQKQVYIDGLIRYRDRSGVQTGTSMALGATALLTVLVQQQFELQEQYALRNNKCAFTGAINENGNVLPVDEKGLEIKVKLCFYSWITEFVVPATQVDIAEKIVIELQKSWPSKKLRIVGVSHLDDIFVNRRLSDYKKESKLIFGSKWLWKRKNTWLGWGSVAVLTLVLLRIWYGPLDKNPVYYEGIGKQWLIKNKSGLTLKTFEADELLIKNHNETYYDYIAFSDIDNDGVNECIIAQKALQIPNKSREMSLYFYSVKDEILLDSISFENNLIYPNQSGADKNGTLINNLHVQGEFIFVSVSFGGSFNSSLYKVHLKTREILQQYAHPGGILDFIDLEHPISKKKLLGITAVNNAFWDGAFILLDPDSIHGMSLTTNDYSSNWEQKAKELAYIRIPMSKVGKSRMFDKMPYPWRIDLDKKDVFIVVSDFSVHSNMGYYFNGYYEISFNVNTLEPQSILTSDQFDIQSRRMFENGVLDSIPNKHYWDSFMKSFLYWNGKAWQNEPTWANYED